MLVTNDAAVFQAWSALTAGKPSESSRCCCTRWKPYRNSRLTTEKASTLRRYVDQRWSASGSTPITRYRPRSTRLCREPA